MGDRWSPLRICWMGKGTSRHRLFFTTTPSLRAASPQGEAFCKAPIEGSCRQSRLRGGDRKIGNGDRWSPLRNIKTHKKTPPYRRCQKHIHIGGSKCFKWGSYHNYKRCNIYMKQISKIFVTFGGTLAFGEGKGIWKKGWYRLFLHSLSIKTG